MSVEDIGVTVVLAKEEITKAGLAPAEVTDADLGIGPVEEEIRAAVGGLRRLIERVYTAAEQAETQLQDVARGEGLLARSGEGSYSSHLNRARRAAALSADALVQRSEELAAMGQVLEETCGGILCLLGEKLPGYVAHSTAAAASQNAAHTMGRASLEAADDYLAEIGSGTAA